MPRATPGAHNLRQQQEPLRANLWESHNPYRPILPTGPAIHQWLAGTVDTTPPRTVLGAMVERETRIRQNLAPSPPCPAHIHQRLAGTMDTTPPRTVLGAMVERETRIRSG